MIHLQLSETLLDSQGNPPLTPELFELAAERTLDQQRRSDQADLTVVLSDDDHLQALNRDYLGFDSPTDVLSFPSGEIDPDSGHVYLGDVIISYPRAAAQAQAAGHPLEAELRLLVVHGVLHLLGHDHADEAEKTAMWAAQDEILASLE
jgi:probable rRNA maturation factor